MTELEVLARPLVEYLHKNYHPHTAIVVTDERVVVAECATSIPLQKRGMESIPTCELVAELEKREGVETTIAEPYQDVQIKVNGPATVLSVID